MIVDLAARGRLVRQCSKDEATSELLKRIRDEKYQLLRSGDVRSVSPRTTISSGAMPYELPVGWSWVRFGDLILRSDSGWSPKAEGFARFDNNWGVLKVSAVSWDAFRPYENKQLLPGVIPPEQARVHRGDFLISRANTSELIAKAVVVGDEPRNLILSDKIVRLHISDHCSKAFLAMVNNHTTYARTYYAEKASGTSLSMKNISRDVIYDLLIPLPPFGEQSRIMTRVKELLDVCDLLSIRLMDARAAQRALLDATLARALVDHSAIADSGHPDNKSQVIKLPQGGV
jgi:type I restriction enzyme S subunit